MLSNVIEGLSYGGTKRGQEGTDCSQGIRLIGVFQTLPLNGIKLTDVSKEDRETHILDQ